MDAAAQGRTWLEVALNGPWSRTHQSRIPVTVKEIVDEGIACVQAGTSIVHAHAYNEATGRQTQSPDVYARIIDGIRSKVDAMVHPTIAAPGLGAESGGQTSQQRFAHVKELARRGLIEWATIDPGSANFSRYDDLREDKPGFVYFNPEEDVHHGLRLAMRFGLHPSYAIYEPGFVRLGATLHWRESSPEPVYRLVFSSGYTFSFPPEDYALTAYLKLLDQVVPGAQWMVAGPQVDVLPMIPGTLAQGGHFRVGLEDASFGCDLCNPQLVERAAQKILDIGGELATAAHVLIAIAPEEHGAA